MPLKAEGEFALVWKYLGEALDRPDEITPDLFFYSLLVDSAAMSEDRQKLAEYIPWFTQEAKRHDHKLFQAVALRSQAVVNRLDAKYKPAQDQLKKAQEIFLEMDTHWQLGRTHMEFGHVYRAQDDLSKAREHYQLAAGFFDRLNAQPDLRRALDAVKMLTS